MIAISISGSQVTNTFAGGKKLRGTYKNSNRNSGTGNRNQAHSRLGDFVNFNEGDTGGVVLAADLDRVSARRNFDNKGGISGTRVEGKG